MRGAPSLNQSDPSSRVAKILSEQDPATFERVIRTHQAGVWRFLRALGCPTDLADDLTQETFLTAYDRGLQDVHPKSTAGYLRRIARHLYLRTHRTTRRREEIFAEAAEMLWNRDCGEDEGEEWLDALRGCIAEVDPRGQRVLTRVYRDGASRSEVAAELSLRENGVKTLLHRIRQSLRDCVRRKLS